MRLYLLPISTRRTLIYAQRFHVPSSAGDRNYVDKAVGFAAKTWAGWEKKERGWQRRVVDYGNHVLRRIPYEEWGLKSVPPLSARRRSEESTGKDKVQLVFPRAVIPLHKVEAIVRTLATEREGLHKKRLMWCIVGMPLTIPIGLLPIIPNLPFFYLVYRAWSHWRAIVGGRHIQWLIQNQLLVKAPSEKLDRLYREDTPPFDDSSDGREQMLLTQDQVSNFTSTLEMPALGIELERAIWQVENALAEARGKTAKDTEKSREASKETEDK